MNLPDRLNTREADVLLKYFPTLNKRRRQDDVYRETAPSVKPTLTFTINRLKTERSHMTDVCKDLLTHEYERCNDRRDASQIYLLFTAGKQASLFKCKCLSLIMSTVPPVQTSSAFNFVSKPDPSR